MAGLDVALLAGTVSTFIFVGSYLPMLVKAVRSKDLSSYSIWNLALANIGNLVHSIYIFSLPAGPLWALHSFYLGGSALMLLWWARYRRSNAAGFERMEQPQPAVEHAHGDARDRMALELEELEPAFR